MSDAKTHLSKCELIFATRLLVACIASQPESLLLRIGKVRKMYSSNFGLMKPSIAWRWEKQANFLLGQSMKPAGEEMTIAGNVAARGTIDRCRVRNDDHSGSRLRIVSTSRSKSPAV